MRILTTAIVAAAVFCMVLPMSNAADEEGPQMSIEADLELFYELSKDVGGPGDIDKFTSNQLYVDIVGQFDDNHAARLKLDGADIESAGGKTVSAGIIEEANFSARKIAGSPVSLVLGKDEMPFGLDYDKYLNDSIAHQFEVDKVWGVHGIVDIPAVGNVAAATYQHRHSVEGEIDSSNQIGNNYCAKLTINKLIENLTVNISGGTESYSDVETTDEATGLASTSARDDEIRWGAGAVFKIEDIGNINAEYIGFSNLQGTPDYNPGLVTVGLQCDMIDNTAIWARYEMILADAADVETGFWTVGVKYECVENFDVMLEYSNFNSGDMKDANDLNVEKGTTENALLVGVRASF
ncbi:MAG: hypothetical protein HQ559_06955 [Lentisphaerae bacterium]|nr:hypothetical protein [Lentisphaerota bacterium]